MASFFIDRPIFAWVLAIVIMLAGLAATLTLPLERYPDIAPTRISINTSYPGASAKTIEDSVTQIIEQNLKGIDGLLSIESSSNASGTASSQLSFVAGTDPDTAQMQVQNKVQQAISRLPQAVQAQGVRVTKAGTDLLMVVTLNSDDPAVTSADMGDYLQSTLVDIISRIEGVGDVNVFGSGYAMRIWLDPSKLQRYALVPGDIRSAPCWRRTPRSRPARSARCRRRRASGSPRSSPRAPSCRRPRSSATSCCACSPTARRLRLGDVARVELGRDSYTTNIRTSGRTAAGMAIFPASGANALVTADAVKAKLDELAPFFPPGMKATVTFDTTPFVRVSIEGVVKTLIEAMVLVVAIMYLFMQNLRATLIPAIAVPVVMLGTMGVLAVAGFSINTLTMFGLVLAIGLLVDDAIVVVENVERLMREEGLSPRDATRKSMGEISGALVGIAVVLSAVFIPMAFFGGSTGVIYRQFSITVVSAMVLSVLVAMSLSPALCATLLKPVHKGEHAKHGGPLGPLLDRFFGGFNRLFDRFTERYVKQVGWLSARGLAQLRGVPDPDRRHRGAVPHAAHQLPARRGPGRPADPGAHGAGRHRRAAGGRDAERRGLPGRAARGAVLQPGARLRRRPGLGPGLHPPEGLVGARRREPGRRGAGRALQPRTGPPRARCQRLRRAAAHGARPGRQRRCAAVPAGPGRPGPARRWRRRATSSSTPPRRAPNSAARAPTAWPRRRSWRSTSTTTRPARWA